MEWKIQLSAIYRYVVYKYDSIEYIAPEWSLDYARKHKIFRSFLFIIIFFVYFLLLKIFIISSEIILPENATFSRLAIVIVFLFLLSLIAKLFAPFIHKERITRISFDKKDTKGEATQ